MRFAGPGWLLAGLLSCIALVWLWRRYDARQHAALTKFVSAHLRQQLTRSISPGRRRIQRGLFLGAVLFLFVTLAGPQVGFRWELVNRRGNEIIFALDTSRSMLTPDVRPNRLTRAKLAIDDFAKKLDGDAVGIVAFAGTAFLACPVTLDYGAFHESLNAIDTNTIPRGGTNISSAIQAAQAALRRRPGGDKILILVTDGEDLEGSSFDTAQATAKSDALKIYTVGVGTAAGDLIPVSSAQGGGFVKDETGAFVKSRLDEQSLKAIAGATGGFYVPLGAQAEGLELIYQTVLGAIAKHDLASRQQKIYIERYQWSLAASLAMLLVSLLVGSRRRGGVAAAKPAALAPAVMLAIAILPHQAHADSGFDSQGPVQQYNAGTAAYRAAQYPQAAQSFQQSISQLPSDDPKRLAIQEDAYYNLGNTLYRTGQKTEQSSPQQTLQKWNEAVKAYETALQLRADDADSKFNRDLVKRKIEELQQKQNQNQQNKNQQNKNQDQQNKNQNQQQDQQNKDQQNPNQQPNKDPQNKDPQKKDPQNKDQPPDKGSGQQDQPPNPQAKNNDPKQDPNQGQGQPPQAKNGQPNGGQPPQGDGQSPAAPKDGDRRPSPEEARSADNQRVPGQMTREEARELLDSVKGDEHQSMPIPWAQRGGVPPPDKPFKNW